MKVQLRKSFNQHSTHNG